MKDAEWIADLLQHGLLRPRLIPPASQREVRELTRYRTSLVEERSLAINRLQKALLRLLGASARDMLAALLEGETDVTVLSQLARGRLSLEY